MTATPTFFYFDLGNVLLSFDYDVAADKMAELCGISSDQCREIAFGEKTLIDFESGKLSREQFHQQFSKLTGSTGDIDALLAARSDIFKLMAPTARIVTQLKGVRRRTGLLSNTSPDHFEFCRRRFGVVRELFDEYVLSYEVGVMKPDLKIFNVAIEKAGVPAAQIFYVDDREENVAGAKAAGIDAVLFTNADQLMVDLRARGVELNL